MKKIIIIIFSIFLLTSCSVNKSDFEIILDGNPTTGYEWDYEISDTSVVKCTDSEYVQYETDGIVGAGGKFIFDFKPLSKGQTSIKFIYARSWEKDIDPVYVITYNLKVGSSKEVVIVSKSGTYSKEEIPNIVKK